MREASLNEPRNGDESEEGCFTASQAEAYARGVVSERHKVQHCGLRAAY